MVIATVENCCHGKKLLENEVINLNNKKNLRKKEYCKVCLFFVILDVVFALGQPNGKTNNKMFLIALSL